MAKKRTGGKKKEVKEKARETSRKKNRIPWLALVGVFFLFFVVVSHFWDGVTGNDIVKEKGEESNLKGVSDVEKNNPLATIELEGGGVIKVELDPENAPNTVKNFIYLAGEGYYDGLTFHRVIPDFMIQGGCPEGKGTGGPGYNIKGEFPANGHPNKLSHQRGVISMARANPPDSAGSQFFITVVDTPHLDGQYAAFGKVIQGMEEADRIVEVPKDQMDRPLEKEVIKKIRVETFGVEYGPPEKL